MTTTFFILTVAIVFMIHGLVLLIGNRMALRVANMKFTDLLHDEAEQRNLRLLPFLGNAIFALLFAFLLFQFGDAVGEIKLWDGLLYGLAIGMLVYLPQCLTIIAIFARVREIIVRWTILGIAGSLLSGAAISFVL